MARHDGDNGPVLYIRSRGSNSVSGVGDLRTQYESPTIPYSLVVSRHEGRDRRAIASREQSSYIYSPSFNSSIESIFGTLSLPPHYFMAHPQHDAQNQEKNPGDQQGLHAQEQVQAHDTGVSHDASYNSSRRSVSSLSGTSLETNGTSLTVDSVNRDDDLLRRLNLQRDAQDLVRRIAENPAFRHDMFLIDTHGPHPPENSVNSAHTYDEARDLLAAGMIRGFGDRRRRQDPFMGWPGTIHHDGDAGIAELSDLIPETTATQSAQMDGDMWDTSQLVAHAGCQLPEEERSELVADEINVLPLSSAPGSRTKQQQSTRRREMAKERKTSGIQKRAQLKRPRAANAPNMPGVKKGAQLDDIPCCSGQLESITVALLAPEAAAAQRTHTAMETNNTKRKNPIDPKTGKPVRGRPRKDTRPTESGMVEPSIPPSASQPRPPHTPFMVPQHPEKDKGDAGVVSSVPTSFAKSPRNNAQTSHPAPAEYAYAPSVPALPDCMNQQLAGAPPQPLANPGVNDDYNARYEHSDGDTTSLDSELTDLD